MCACFRCVLYSLNWLCMVLANSISWLFVMRCLMVVCIVLFVLILYFCFMDRNRGQLNMMCLYVCGVLQVGQFGSGEIFQMRWRYSRVGPCPVRREVIA